MYIALYIWIEVESYLTGIKYICLSHEEEIK